MNVEKKVPVLRFEGFSSEWEASNINDSALYIDGNYGEKYPKANEFIESGVPFFTSAVIGTSGIFNKKNIKYISEEKNSTLVKAQSLGGDLILTNRGASMGSVAQIPQEYGVVNIGPQLTRIRGTEKVDNLFLLSILKHPIYNQKLLSINAGSAMNFVGLGVLGRFEFLKPTIEEQTQIGNTFQKLDNLINQHQQKHDKLSNIKKAMLEKMFPKKGETIPEIRFKGFSGEWEESSIGEICGATFGGGTPSTNDKDFWQGEIPWIQSSDLKDGIVSSVTAKKYITKSAVNKSATKLISGNSIGIVTRVGVGKLSLMQGEYATSQDFLSLSDLKIDSQYAAYVIWKQLQIEKEQVQGTSIKGITKDELLGKLINYPETEEEQTAIGNYFQKLDALINQHQQQITKLNNIKQACLSKMFV